MRSTVRRGATTAVSRCAIAAAAGLLTLAGCATVRTSMLSSAGTLESSANAFLGQASEAGRAIPHAADFAADAHHFVETVNRAGDREVMLTYEHLWDAYHTLRDEVAASGSERARIDFEPVTRAFAGVALDIRGYADADSALYARGGFQHDPYYDP